MASQFVLYNSTYLFEALLGLVLVFAGNTLADIFKKKKNIRAFVRFLLSTGFAYGFTIIRCTVEFFVDYYSKSTCLQKFNGVPAENLWLIKLFGVGAGNVDQYPVFDINLTFVAFVFGSALGGLILWLAYSSKEEKRIQSHYRKQSFKAYGKSEIAELKRTVALPEYISWWVLRVAMVIALIYVRATGKKEGLPLVIMEGNLALTFLIPLIRFVFFKKIFFGNLPFRVQSMINVFIFIGSFLGHGCDLLGKVPEYDKIEHLVSGVVTMLIGYVILKSLQDERLGVSLLTIGSVGFSGVVIIVWEIFEFFCDYFIPGSNNQNWYFEPTSDMLFVRIFGSGAGKIAQYPILDTQLDIIYALIGMSVCLPFLSMFIYRENLVKQKNKNQYCVKA